MALLIAMLGAANAQTVPEISWRVENPFRLFTDAADSEVHRATYQALSEDERRHPILAAERALAERHPEGWAATMFRSTCWNVSNNRFSCAEVPDYTSPKVHKIRAEVVGIPDSQGVDCTWLTAPTGGRQRGAAITVPCDTQVALDIPYPGGAKISVEVGGQKVSETNAKIRDLLVVGFGDSFGSGEGNPDVPVRFSRERTADYGLRSADAKLDGYPARVGDWEKIGDRKFITENAQWMDQACHRSLYSHQLRAALQLAVEEPHRAVTYVGLACSGAETTFGLFLRYKGHEWVPNPPDVSQISAAAMAQCGNVEPKAYDLPEAYHMNEKVPELKGGLVLRKCDLEKARKIDLILLSIGGNDIGFSRLVANAVLADQSSLRSLGGWFGQVHGFSQAQALLDVLDDRYKSLNRAFHNILHLPWSENDRVILTAYPPLSVMEDGKAVCPDGQAGMTVLPDFNLSEAKAREGEVAATRMHDVMKASAKTHGWTFAEAHRRDFQGRGVCAGWSDNAFNSADDLRIPRKIDGKWDPYNPADWRAYAPRQRWFRTPNDAFMTGNFHVTQSALQTVMKNQGYAWVQLLLASIYSGAFHPTGEGHAAIADSVVEKARGVLAKYGSGGPPERQRAER
jgi:lysophospholipase L1-like esterase